MSLTALAIWYDAEHLKAAVWNASSVQIRSLAARTRLGQEVAAHLTRHLSGEPATKTSWVSAKLVRSVWTACGGKNPGVKYDLAAKAILARIFHPKGCPCLRCKGRKHLSGCECGANGKCARPPRP